jgi:antitoxin (DNA-binding transcriptional repressor) of toxin-antitoxin stability system
MKLVKVSEAKNGLSRHLEYVKRGGRVRILDRDTPVADLVPVEQDGLAGDDERWLATQQRRGLLKRGTGGRLPADLLRPGPGGPSAGVVDELLEQRRGGR